MGLEHFAQEAIRSTRSFLTFLVLGVVLVVGLAFPKEEDDEEEGTIGIAEVAG